MNQHTARVIKDMLSLLASYRQDNVSLRHLVRNLEAGLGVLDERLSEAFYQEWFKHWGSLEEVLATNLEEDYREQLLAHMEALESLLNDLVVEPSE